MKNNKNDKRILALKEEIENQKKVYNGIENFNPETHCSLEIGGYTYNLHSLNLNACNRLLVELNMYKISGKDLCISSEEIFFSGYSIDKWISDLAGVKGNIIRREKKAKLNEMKNKLEKMLSEDAKIEIELSKMEEELDIQNE